MVCNMPELSLDLSLPAIESPVPDFLTKLPITGVGESDDLSNLKEFVKGLEDELKKIQAFKRELPYSFILLTDAIRKLKEKEKKYEEIKKEGKLSGDDVGDMKNWMSSAQLWCPRSEAEDESQKSEGGVVSSFKECGDKVPKLSLTPVVLESDSMSVRLGGGSPGPILLKAVEQTAKPQIKPCQTGRKQRRCWSPELHRRFVDALEQLGGSQVATPKQIRELMQVEGLTNDEVKSHLQKYRLHVRKLPGSSSKTPSSPSEGMDGDKFGFGCSSMDILQLGSPEGPLHLEASRKCNSSSVEDDEEEKSDGQSWKVHRHVIVT